jgi:DNA polymerase
MTSCFEEGNPNAEICIVGEAPSFMEIRENRPFVGPSGKLLEQCLHASKIVRAKTYIINVFEEIVYKKKEKPEIFDQYGTMLWTPAGFTPAGKEASKRSLARLRASKANVTIPMGGTALHMCLRKFNGEIEETFEKKSISKWRGSIFYGIDGKKLVPTYHPSFALKGSYEGRYYIISDLRKALDESTSKVFIPTPRNLIIDPSYDACIEYLKKCLKSNRVNTDIEILGGQMDCFSLSIDPSEAISIPLLDAGFEPRWSATEEFKILELYAQIIGSPRIEKVNQNIAFDLAALLMLNKIVPRGVLHDPMVAFSVMNAFLDKKLGVVCSMCTREPYYKDDGTLEDSANIDDFARRWEYNAKDSAISLESFLYLEPDLDAEGYRETYNLHMGEMPAIIYMMAQGTMINEKALAGTKAEAYVELAKTVAKLSEAMGRPVITATPKKVAEKREVERTGAINVNSPKQLANYFYVEKKIRPYTNPGGTVTTDDKAMAQLVRRYSLPEAKLIQEYRAQAKMLGTYLEMGYDSDKRLRCSYNIRGTWTGRLSSSQTVFNTGGNMQNIPPEMRGFFVSDEVGL